MSGPSSRSSGPSWLDITTRRDRAAGTRFALLWLLPATLVGLTNERISFLPAYLNYQYEIGGLFPFSTTGWTGFHFLLKLEGSDRWFQPPEEDYFRAEPFGHFSRLHMLYIIESLDQDKFVQVRRELRDFIARRHAELHPEAPPVEKVRFVMTQWPVGGENARPKGHWQTPRLADIPREQWFRYPDDESADDG